jgi:hypothetical protein
MVTNRLPSVKSRPFIHRHSARIRAANRGVRYIDHVNVAVQVEFKTDRKEPLGELIRRVAELFDRNGLQAEVVATFSDGPGGIRHTSAVERALKKHPHLGRFERNDAPLQGPGLPTIRRLTNGEASNPFPMTDILALADGVPRSLPFHAVSVQFGHADFGRATFPLGVAPPTGITISDGWWVSGRIRGLHAFYAVEGDAASKKLPDPPSAIAAIFASLGKPKRKAQFIAPTRPLTPSAAPQLARVRAIVVKYRSGMKALVERIGLPYDLPPGKDVLRASLGARGPLKPTLVDVFTPRGYDCRGDSGTFTLRRRTRADHVVEIELDVGTWSRSLTFMFHVYGPEFTATLMPPVTLHGDAGQYPIGDTASWERIVANMAAIVDELDRTFVVEIDDAAGQAPEWFDPGR